MSDNSLAINHTSKTAGQKSYQRLNEQVTHASNSNLENNQHRASQQDLTRKTQTKNNENPESGKSIKKVLRK